MPAMSVKMQSSVTNNVEWMCGLNPQDHPPAHWRRSAIICTIGPKTNNPEMMNKLRAAGMNVVRMNFSHGEYSYHQSVIDNARKAEADQEGRPLAIALDTVSVTYRALDVWD